MWCGDSAPTSGSSDSVAMINRGKGAVWVLFVIKLVWGRWRRACEGKG